MTTSRTIELFSGGCPLCREAERLVNRLACPGCRVGVVDIGSAAGYQRAKAVGVGCVPAVAVNGTLASCCAGRGPDEAGLRAAGLGQPLP